jgi:hypothetical protein
MGASAREIEREIRATRERMDENLTRLESRAASNAKRYARIAAVGIGVIAVGATAFIVYRRTRKPTLRDRLDDVSIDNLRAMLDNLSAKLKEELPSVTVRVNEKKNTEPGTLEGILRRVAPAVVGSAVTTMLNRISRAPTQGGPGRAAPQAE